MVQEDVGQKVVQVLISDYCANEDVICEEFSSILVDAAFFPKVSGFKL